jgi:hypothetical protein
MEYNSNSFSDGVPDEAYDAMLAALRDEFNAPAPATDGLMNDTGVLPTEFASEYGTHDTEGSRVVDAIGQTAERLRDEYGADVTVVPYHLAYKGTHSIGASMGPDRNVIYIDNQPVAEM